MVSPAIGEESVDPPFPNPQEFDEEFWANWTSDFTGFDSDMEEYNTDEYIQRYEEEIDRTGMFEIDFPKLPYWFGSHPLDLNDSTKVDEPETDGDFAAMLANVALAKHNAEQKTNLVLAKIVRATYHLSAGYTFYISFEVIDGNQTIPYQAVVRHLAGEIEVYSCNPKP